MALTLAGQSSRLKYTAARRYCLSCCSARSRFSYAHTFEEFESHGPPAGWAVTPRRRARRRPPGMHASWYARS
jgi:hypothetical protein